MRLFIILIVISIAAACSAPAKKLTPLETIQSYSRAFKKRDAAQMKRLMSRESIKMIEEEAKAQNAAPDDVILRETLFSETTTSVKYRNVREEEATSSIEVEDSTGIWNTVHFVREEGFWKIDKKGFANQIEMDSQKSQEELDRIINEGKQQ